MTVTGWKVCPSCMGAKCKICKNLGYIGEKPSKYRNEKTTVNGIKFDSKAESDYYVYLKELEAYGVVTKIELQPSFQLTEKFTDQYERVHQAVKYIADFRVSYKDGREIVIDVKGVQTADFKIKRKLYALAAMREGWPELAVIAFDKKMGWIDADQLSNVKAGKLGKATSRKIEWGPWIKEKRKAMKLMSKDLASNLGVTAQTVNGWEQGRRKPPSAMAKRIVEFFGSKPAGY